MPCRTWGRAMDDSYFDGSRRDWPEVLPPHANLQPNQQGQIETPPWPELAPEALHGLAGEIVTAATKNSEADPAAVLATLLTHAGIVAGRGPRVRVSDDFHHARLFVAIVGQSARGRKGTSEKPVRRIGEIAAAVLGPLNWQPGPLSTGEGLAYAIRDGDEDGDSGVKDKRLFVGEAEFAAPLRAMQRQGNTLSTALRSAWDGTTIAPMTKGSRIRASDPHVGIVGHITKQELREQLSRGDIFNGFANRFLWWCARRSKSLPLASGMSQSDVERLGTKYASRLDTARQFGEVEFSDDARKLYVALYGDLTKDGTGLHAIVTARAEAQLIRLALTYAVIEASPVITTHHLNAAVAVWDYCDGSALYLFGDSQPNPLEGRIVEALRVGPQSTTELHRALSGHVPAAALKAALESLEACGQLLRLTDATAGRPRVTWQIREGFSHAKEAKKANLGEGIQLISHSPLSSHRLLGSEGPCRS